VKAVAALAALAFGALVPAAPPLATAVEESVTTINILGVADLHGHIERTTDPATGEVVDPGAATVACEVAGARESDPGSLLVSSGDNVGGSPPVSALLDDQPTLDVLNAMGTDVSALGDHELDKGLDDLTGRILPAASFPYLSANVTGTALDSEGDGDGTVVKNAGGVKVGFVGIMTDDLPSLLAPAAAAAARWRPSPSRRPASTRQPRISVAATLPTRWCRTTASAYPAQAAICTKPCPRCPFPIKQVACRRTRLFTKCWPFTAKTKRRKSKTACRLRCGQRVGTDTAWTFWRETAPKRGA